MSSCMGCRPSCSSQPKTAMTTTVSQFAKEVLHFSSQYGTDGSVSYVVPNLAGPSTIYPSYGDMTAACVFVSMILITLLPIFVLFGIDLSKKVTQLLRIDKGEHTVFFFQPRFGYVAFNGKKQGGCLIFGLWFRSTWMSNYT